MHLIWWAGIFSVSFLRASDSSEVVTTNWPEDDDFYALLEATGVLENTVFTSSADGAAIDKHFKNGAGQPVVIKRAWTPPPSWASKEAFLQAFGSVRVPIRWPIGTRPLGLLERLDSIKNYVGAMNLEPSAGMVFGSPCSVTRSVLCTLDRHKSKVLSAVSPFANVSSDGTSLSLGPSRVGLPWHNHYSNW
eukprot:SAG22_NODE_7421_length_741_cov_1.327103_1_plen_190_part_10